MTFDADIFLTRPAPAALFAPAPVACPFRDVRWAEFEPHEPPRARGAKREGLRYERRVHDVLSAIYGTAFTPHPTILYSTKNRIRSAAIPDGVLRVGGTIFVIEIKLSHTERAWEQLMTRYAPLVRALEPQRALRTVEICRTYDPAVELPGPHELIESLHRTAALGRGASARAASVMEVLRWPI